MCFITVIHKCADGQKDEYKIKLNSSQLVSLETPYYIVAEDKKDSVHFIYVYSEESSNTSLIQIDDLKVIYGDYTGRVFHIATTKNLHKLKSINTKDLYIEGWRDVKINNLKLGLNIYNSIVECLNHIN